jgi:hypothetical protein
LISFFFKAKDVVTATAVNEWRINALKIKPVAETHARNWFNTATCCACPKTGFGFPVHFVSLLEHCYKKNGDLVDHFSHISYFFVSCYSLPNLHNYWDFVCTLRGQASMLDFFFFQS